MSRLSEMIKKLCPDGVEYRKLKEIFDTRNGYTPSKSNDSYWENGTIPWFRMEDIRENGHILSDSIQHVNSKAIKGDLFPANSIIVATSATIGEHALITVPSLANQRFTYLMLKHEFTGVFDIKFLFYYCYKLDLWCLSHLNQGSFPSVDMKQFAQFEIPVPPLPIQNEIVKLLDNFTELTAELTAELLLRKKQYNFYRDSLLNFDQNDRDVEWKTIGMIGDVTKLAGFEFTKYVTYVETGKIIALRGLNVKGKLDLTDVKYLDGSDLTKLERSKLYKDDILFTYVGTVGQVALVDCDDKYYLAPNVARIRFDKEVVDPAYIRYFFQTEYFMRKQIEKYAKTSSMKNLTMENIRKFQVPIPPLEVQAKIVSILDRFDTLCNDLSQGLPAEIAARKKQYEYYRDKLLTFRHKEA